MLVSRSRSFCSALLISAVVLAACGGDGSSGNDTLSIGGAAGTAGQAGQGVGGNAGQDAGPDGDAGQGGNDAGQGGQSDAAIEVGDGDGCMPQTETCNGVDDNCDGVTDEGCECLPNDTKACYSGADGTEGIGVCKAGTATCDSSGKYGPCEGMVAPSDEECNGEDDDCNGQLDDGLGNETCGVGACQVTVPTCKDGAVQPCVPLPSAPVEACNGLDDNCEGTVDEGCICITGKEQACYSAAPNTKGVGVCKEGTQTCDAQGQWGPCGGEVTPVDEKCDSLDNDCDAEVDEGNPGAGVDCSVGKPGVCDYGKTSCSNGEILCNQMVQPSAETCDGIDNDCDGVVDNGNPGAGLNCDTGKPGVCAAGTTACQAGLVVCNQNVQPSAETCDGIDSDCDGVVDNGNPGAGLTCDTGKPGVCAVGITACDAGLVVCNQNVQPSAETCDGIDSDCDGVVDNGNPGAGLNCDTGKPGVCAAGTTACQAGTLSCSQNVQPSAEICDGKDNDCNGVVDNGNPGGGASCNTGKLGVCAAGITACQAGTLSCSQNVQPSPELCNSLDDDCDGTVDEACSGCAHDKCQTGSPLVSTCDSCVATICASDSFCCTGSWDYICVAEVGELCGSLKCTQGTCSHTACATGAPLVSGCEDCVTQICGADPFCCQSGWDYVCVEAVQSICGKNCT